MDAAPPSQSQSRGSAVLRGVQSRLSRARQQGLEKWKRVGVSRRRGSELPLGDHELKQVGTVVSQALLVEHVLTRLRVRACLVCGCGRCSLSPVPETSMHGYDWHAYSARGRAPTHTSTRFMREQVVKQLQHTEDLLVRLAHLRVGCRYAAQTAA